jgi:RNA polymerase sigma-70 factor (ECF subfamily)
MDDPSNHTNLDELAQRIYRDPGDEGSWTALYQLTYKRFFRMALARVGNHEDAKDLLQEVWTKIAAARHDYNPDRPFLPWMYTIFNNTVKDFWRRKGREPRFLGLDNVIVLPDRGQDIDTALDREQLRELLQETPPNLRHALVDHFVGGLSFRDIAREQGVPESTLRGQIIRVIGELQPKADRWANDV